MRFDLIWIDRGVESVSYMIKLNSTESEVILCQQWLSDQLTKLQDEGKVVGVGLQE